jgi:predicted metalloprotease
MIIVGLVGLAGLVFTDRTQDAPNAAYQNEDYQVPPPDTSPPPLPVPRTYEEAERLLVSNRFYLQTVPIPVRCTAQPINVATADNAQLESHFTSLTECLVRVWQPPVEAAGYQVVRPTVTIYGSKITTKCGDAEVNAFYCAGDQQVYFSNRLPDYVPIVKQNKWAADVVMAHEFGHALQARTAILISSHALGQQSGEKQTELELSRRLEVQADCLSGMFMNSVALSLGIQPSDVDGIEATYEAVGDDVVSGKPNIVGNHGLARSRVYWGDVGLNSTDVGDCNTFTASTRLVR